MTSTRNTRGPDDASDAGRGSGDDEEVGDDERRVASLFRSMVDDDDVDAGDTDDQLAGEDAKLRAMRSVWLTMRDEEPSDGGLAVLMAAARSKAAELTPPTLWQRALAGLRRPPVLAFATVLVLLGGAVVVGRGVERDGVPMAASPQAEAPSAATTIDPAASADGVVAQDARLRKAAVDVLEATKLQREGGPASPAAVVEPSGAGRAKDERMVPAPPMPAHRPAPVASKPAQMTTLEADAGDGRPAAAVPTAPRATPPARVGSSARDDDAYQAPAREAKTGGVDGASKLGQAEQAADAVTPARAPNAPPLAAPGAGTSRKPGPIEPAAAPQEGSGATASALYRRCEAAAQRRDCVEVRRLAREISVTDPGYRARVTQEARTAPSSAHGQIARCLME